MNRILQVLTLACFLTASALGQEAPAPATATCAATASAEKKGPAPPRQIRFSGTVGKGDGASAGGDAVALTFSLYETQLGESALWAETQSVALDAAGRYSVLLGATSNEGLPMAIFVAGEARWLGVRVADANSAEQPRVQLVSVPYALAAGDAQSLGGRPVSDFALTKAAARSASQSPDGGGSAPGLLTSGAVGSAANTVNYVAKFTGLDTIGNSNIFDSGTNVGIGTSTPDSLLQIKGSITTPAPTSFDAALAKIDGTVLTNGSGQGYLKGLVVNPTFNTTAGYANYFMGIEVGAVRVGGNIAHSIVNFLSNSQTAFNGSSCVVSFGIDVPNQQPSLCNGNYGFYQGGTTPQYNYMKQSLGIDNPFPTEKLHVTGNIKASGTITGVNFTGTGLFALPATTSSTAGVITSGGNRFLHSFGTNNAFVGGSAGNFTMSGANNSALGFQSLFSNTSGNANTASGSYALFSNTSGGNNTAVGFNALASNSTNSFNTAIGANALNSNTAFDNTAVGYQSLFVNTSGFENAATGIYSLLSNTTGSNNAAFGKNAL
ncbi:MAG: hypothetical protein ABIP81_04020, partial [Terriglobales bacterium]